MAIGAPRWGGLRQDPYRPDSPDADNDGIVQEQTLFERPAGTRIVSTLTGLELELGTPGSSLQDLTDTRLVDREGREVNYRQTWRSSTLSAGEQNGTIGSAGTIGSLQGNLDGPPAAPKPKPIQLRAADVDKSGEPLRVFVSDDRRFHGEERILRNGFGNPAYSAAAQHWKDSGQRLRGTPIGSNDPRIPDTVYHATPHVNAVLDTGTLRARGEGGLGGDSDDKIVSLTTNPVVAQSLAADMKTAITFVNSPESEKRDFLRNLADDLPDSNGRSALEILETNTSFSGDSWDTLTDKDRMQLYFNLRRQTTDQSDPLFYGDLSQFKGMSENDVGIVEVPKTNLATGAAITDFDIGQGFLDELRVYGDVNVGERHDGPVRQAADIPTPDSLKPIKDRFDAEGFELYLVGGAVRDTLMGKEIKDYDLASDATPDEIEAMLTDVDGARLDLTGKDFAVVRVNMPDGEEYEIATFRRDVGEGRRPKVAFTTIDEDVRRRDLTMNALFYDLSTNEIVDYVGGIDDIENGVVRAVGNPEDRFREDPLRILRAFRFSGRTGWGMDSATVEAIRNNSKLSGVSGERVRDEFTKGIKSAVSPSGFIHQIDLVDNGTGTIWGQIFPDVNVSPSRLPADGSYTNNATLLAALLADNDIGKVRSVLKDRKFTNNEIADVELLLTTRSIDADSAVTLKNKFGKNDRLSTEDLRSFFRAQPNTADDIEPFLEFAAAPPTLTANDLQAQGIKPGPQFGAMIREADEQRYIQIRDGFSADKPDTKPLGPRPSNPGEASRASEYAASFNGSSSILEEISQARPLLASNSGKAADSLSNRKGENPGLIYRSPVQMKALRNTADQQLLATLNPERLTPQQRLDADDPDTEFGYYIASMRAHVDLLDKRHQHENGEYLDGYWTQVVTGYDPFDTNVTESIAAVIDSEAFQQEISKTLDLINTDLRSTGDVRVSTAANPFGGQYNPGVHTIDMHPTLFADKFKEAGIPFDEFMVWANPDGKLTNSQISDVKNFFDGVTDSPVEVNPRTLQGMRDTVLTHENFHGVHFLLTEGLIDGDPEWLELRERLFKDLKESGFFGEIAPEGEDDWNDPNNYFNYLMRWMDHTGDRDKMLSGWSPENRNSPEMIDEAAGMEWFAEALAWVSEGREFPGSTAIVEFVNKKLDSSRTDADREAIGVDDVDARSITPTSTDLPPRPASPSPIRTRETLYRAQPQPETITGWDKDRLEKASRPSIHRDGGFPPAADLIDGVHLSEDQKSLSSAISETSDEQLTSLRDQLNNAYVEGDGVLSRSRRSSEVGWQLVETIEGVVAARALMNEPNITPEERETLQNELDAGELAIAEDIVYAVQKHWGEARSELFHWDYLSDRVQSVLGNEFGVDISHEPREPDADIDGEVRGLQSALAPFVDAWVRGQYSSQQKFFADNGITELNVYRGMYVPNPKDTAPDGVSKRVPPRSSRGMESWTTDLDTALGFTGNQFGTSKDAIDAIDGDLGDPSYILMHDVVPAALILGVGDRGNAMDPSASLGESAEFEVVAMGSGRPIDVFSNDVLERYLEPPFTRAGQVFDGPNTSYFTMTESDLFDQLAAAPEAG